MNRTLTPAAADVLRRATATETTVVLPAGQLDRTVYVEVNKALERIGGGGKWDRSAKAHIFSRDPRPELEALAGSGFMPADKNKEMAFFRTPADVANQAVDALVEQFGCSDPVEILEPSAGDGALADAVRDRMPNAHLSVVEPDSSRYSDLHSKAYGVDPHAAWEETFEDFADGLRPVFDGVIPDSLGRDHKSVTQVADLVRQHGVITALPEGAFKVSGTGIRTALIVLDKPEVSL